ncbi:hypothetical protein scyTo_0013032 [Scyliorhinus torazame]|uniref:Uncharacterized protein n=1 Tax=Scyliorhinus torazame TaxID=75743 RepID=A0A401NMQ8_SCYTO|nr:hypothetical protein [Scyliorhinus torazame]
MEKKQTREEKGHQDFKIKKLWNSRKLENIEENRMLREGTVESAQYVRCKCSQLPLKEKVTKIAIKLQ